MNLDVSQAWIMPCSVVWPHQLPRTVREQLFCSTAVLHAYHRANGEYALLCSLPRGNGSSEYVSWIADERGARWGSYTSLSRAIDIHSSRCGLSPSVIRKQMAEGA
jgi:hypothetical protein